MQWGKRRPKTQNHRLPKVPGSPRSHQEIIKDMATEVDLYSFPGRRTNIWNPRRSQTPHQQYVTGAEPSLTKECWTHTKRWNALQLTSPQLTIPGAQPPQQHCLKRPKKPRTRNRPNMASGSDPEQTRNHWRTEQNAPRKYLTAQVTTLPLNTTPLDLQKPGQMCSSQTRGHQTPVIKKRLPKKEGRQSRNYQNSLSSKTQTEIFIHKYD